MGPQCHKMRFRFLPPSVILCLGLAVSPAGAQQVDLEEVACALCHFDEGDEFATSVHYEKGLMVCSDCHGGLPFEADSEVAKAPGTGFIGRPGRSDIATLCSSCHSGPAQFFAVGPHHEWQNEANPTCIACHSNHAVKDATLDLIEETCSKCHESGTPAMARGIAIAASLTAAREDLDHTTAMLDSLIITDRSLQRHRSLLESASSSLREADPRTHALDRAIIDKSLALFREDLASVEATIAGHFETRERRQWIVVAVWVFVVVNVALMWMKRRQLRLRR